MNPLILSSLVIPASIAFVLIALLIKERYDLLPKKTNTNAGKNANENSGAAELKIRDYHQKKFQRKRYPDDFLDFSGGSMGI